MKKRYVSPTIKVVRMMQVNVVCASGYDELENSSLSIFDEEQDNITQQDDIW